jgi:hypothetical protein
MILSLDANAFFSAAKSLRALYSNFSSSIFRSAPFERARMGCYVARAVYIVSLHKKVMRCCFNFVSLPTFLSEPFKLLPRILVIATAKLSLLPFFGLTGNGKAMLVSFGNDRPLKKNVQLPSSSS